MVTFANLGSVCPSTNFEVRRPSHSEDAAHLVCQLSIYNSFLVIRTTIAKIVIFTYPGLHFLFALGTPMWQSRKNVEDIFICFGATHECDGRMDRRTDTGWRHILRLCIASRGTYHTVNVSNLLFCKLRRNSGQELNDDTSSLKLPVFCYSFVK